MTNTKNIYLTIFTISFCALTFLGWFIYSRPAVATDLMWIEYVPFVNALLNLLTSCFLVLGFIYIKKKQIELHKKMMIAATLSSVLFLIGYILYHYFHGESKFVAQGLIRPIYFFILISHIILSAIQLPLILTTLYLAFSGKYIQHRKVAMFTFPIWLYVSVTGVFVFILLKWFNQ